VILPVTAWSPSSYIVLDTARGMLRLKPGSAADMACWALGLNAVLLAAAGGDLLGSVYDMPWSGDVLLQ
jgi:hypothetical protein